MNPIPKQVWEILIPIVGNRMLELGNKKNGKGTYKEYLESIGVEHTSIDWNGQDGALPLDLRKPILLDPFDMVTNFGTTEHVSEQEPAWRNIHNLLKVDGVYVGVTPLPGDWPGHGDHYPAMEFYKEFAKNGYEIEKLEVISVSPKRLIATRFRKTEEKDFVMPDEKLISAI